jgi:hypothetical protein
VVEHAAAHAVARLDDHDRRPGRRHRARRREAREARTDDHYVRFPHVATLPGSHASRKLS